MPRIRSIKPELATSRKLAGVPIEARYTLVLLITQADDEGLVYAEPRQLLGNLYPHDEAVTPDALERWILALAHAKSIALRWTADGARVIQLLGWSEHQVVKNPGKPKISPTLLPLSGDPTEILPRVSVGSGGAEVVGSEVGDSEGGRGKSEMRNGSAADLSVEFVEPKGRDAYLAYRRSHRMPDGLDATLRALHSGMQGQPPIPWERIGAALVEMRGASVDFTARALAGFARRVGEDPRQPNGAAHGTRQARNLEAIQTYLNGEGSDGE